MAKNPDEKYYLGNQNLPTTDAQFEWTPKMLRELKKCKNNILYFAENFFYIVNLDRGRQKIKLHKYQRRILRSLRDNRFTIVLSSRQSGKALALSTPIPSPTGFKQMGDLKDGDTIYGANGQPCKIIKTHDVMYGRPCYRITFDNGEKIIADEEHLWFTQSRQERLKKCSGSVKTTKQILDTLLAFKKGEPNHRIMSCVTGVSGTVQTLPIDPYILGVWLGDGSCDSSTISIGKRDLDEYLKIFASYEQYKTIVHEYVPNNFFLRLGCKNGHIKSEVNLSTQLRESNLFHNKHIPDKYLLASRSQRLELLKGLIDSDGYIDVRGNAQFTNTNLTLAQQVRQLVESLGYKTTYKEYVPELDGKECAMCGVVSFKPREEVAKLSFKKNRIKISPKETSRLRNRWHYIKEIIPVESVPVRCITVDSSDSLYLCGNQYIPTHNTTLMCIYALWIACFNEDQRILIVANKEATAINIFKRVRLAYEMLPNYIKSGVIEYAKTSMILGNGSSVGISTTSSDAGRGDSANVLIIDEMAFVPPELMQPFWNSVYPIISSSKKSKIFIASTPNGTSNLFHDLYRNAEKGLNNWKAERVDWWDVPGRDEAWKENTIKEIGSVEAFDQEYGNKFFQTGESAATDEVVESLRQRCREPKYTFDEGHYKVWEEPNPEAIYVAGVDVGEGVNEAASVIQVFDMTNLTDIRQVAVYHNTQIVPYLFTTKVLEIMQHWGLPPVAIERNNCGAQVVDHLRNTHAYENIINFSPKEENEHRLGCIAHTNTKYKGIVNMRYWINQLNVVTFRDAQTVKELKNFIRYPNGTWAAGPGADSWDDRVMSTVWGLIILESAVTEKFFEIVKYDDYKKPLIIRPSYRSERGAIQKNPFHQYENETPDIEIPGRVLPTLFNTENFGQEDVNPDIEELEEMGWARIN